MTFSLDSYRDLIRTGLGAGFAPTAFGAESTADRVLMLRHDVDYSLEMAVSLARVNAELGVTGTFFILLRGHAYNPLSATSMERVNELVLLGQRLGLHVSGQKEDHI